MPTDLRRLIASSGGGKRRRDEFGDLESNQDPYLVSPYLNAAQGFHGPPENVDNVLADFPDLIRMIESLYPRDTWTGRDWKRPGLSNKTLIPDQRRNPVTIPVLTPQGPRIQTSPEEKKFGALDLESMPTFTNPMPVFEGRRKPLTEQPPEDLTPEEAASLGEQFGITPEQRHEAQQRYIQRQVDAAKQSEFLRNLRDAPAPPVKQPAMTDEQAAFLEKLNNVVSQKGLPDWLAEQLGITPEEREQANELRLRMMKPLPEQQAVMPHFSQDPSVTKLMQLLGVPRTDPIQTLRGYVAPPTEDPTSDAFWRDVRGESGQTASDPKLGLSPSERPSWTLPGFSARGTREEEMNFPFRTPVPDPQPVDQSSLEFGDLESGARDQARAIISTILDAIRRREQQGRGGSFGLGNYGGN